MVEYTIEEVANGHYLGMKYLFEMIGLYPATLTRRRARTGFAGRDPSAEIGSGRRSNTGTRCYERFRAADCFRRG